MIRFTSFLSRVSLAATAGLATACSKGEIAVAAGGTLALASLALLLLGRSRAPTVAVPQKKVYLDIGGRPIDFGRRVQFGPKQRARLPLQDGGQLVDCCCQQATVALNGVPNFKFAVGRHPKNEGETAVLDDGTSILLFPNQVLSVSSFHGVIEYDEEKRQLVIQNPKSGNPIVCDMPGYRTVVSLGETRIVSIPPQAGEASLKFGELGTVILKGFPLLTVPLSIPARPQPIAARQESKVASWRSPMPTVITAPVFAAPPATTPEQVEQWVQRAISPGLDVHVTERNGYFFADIKQNASNGLTVVFPTGTSQFRIESVMKFFNQKFPLSRLPGMHQQWFRHSLPAVWVNVEFSHLVRTINLELRGGRGGRNLTISREDLENGIEIALSLPTPREGVGESEFAQMVSVWGSVQDRFRALLHDKKVTGPIESFWEALIVSPPRF